MVEYGEHSSRNAIPDPHTHPLPLPNSGIHGSGSTYLVRMTGERVKRLMMQAISCDATRVMPDICAKEVLAFAYVTLFGVCTRYLV